MQQRSLPDCKCVVCRRCGIFATIATAEVASSLDFPTEVGLDRLLASGILGGDIQELPRHARGLTAERVDKGLADRVIDEGDDDVHVGDIGELISLLREALNVLLEGLIGPLLAVVEIPGVPRVGVGTLEVADADRREIVLAADAAGLELLESSPG